MIAGNVSFYVPMVRMETNKEQMIDFVFQSDSNKEPFLVTRGEQIPLDSRTSTEVTIL